MKTSCWTTSVVKQVVFAQLTKAGLFIASLFLFIGCSQQASYQTFSDATMGTRYNISAQLPQGVKKAAVQKKIDERLEQINHSMSTWRDNSLISQFNRAAVASTLEVDADFIQVLQISRDVYQASAGAFNPAVGALVDLWGFGPRLSIEQIQQLPAAQDIADAMAKTDFTSVKNNGLMLEKTAELQLDFSAVAKGYGVDALAHVLRDFGVKNYMVEIGGEIATLGHSAKGKAWRIGIESPDNVRGHVITAIDVMESAMATSGDYRNFFNVDGKHCSHTIDPRTGSPISNPLASVTVLADNVAIADAWATALTVMGEQQALVLAEKFNLAVYLIVHKDGEFVSAYSTAMKAYLN